MALRRDDATEPRGEDGERAGLVEEMGLIWTELGEPRMQGRVLGYLMLSNAPYVSSAELVEALKASTGSISSATKVLVEEGFIRRVAIPAQRSFFYRAEDDVWGAFLATESRYLRRRQRFAERVLGTLGEAEDHPRQRFTNMRDYHGWLMEHRRQTLTEWTEFKAGRDAAEAQPTGKRPQRRGAKSRQA